MHVKTFHSSGFHRLATSRKSRRLFSSLLVVGCVALAGATCQTALAQEADTSPAVRDSFSISSAYFENNYANNVDYAQFTIDAHSASGRLALYGYNKYADVLNGPWSRVAYVGATRLVDILLESLHDPAIAEFEAAWELETERRLAEYDSGETYSIDGDEVFAKARSIER